MSFLLCCTFAAIVFLIMGINLYMHMESNGSPLWKAGLVILCLAAFLGLSWLVLNIPPVAY